MDEQQIKSLAGLDRAPEQILADEVRKIQRLRSEYYSWRNRFRRFRARGLEGIGSSAELKEHKRLLEISLASWLIYSLCQVVLLGLTLAGIISVLTAVVIAWLLGMIMMATAIYFSENKAKDTGDRLFTGIFGFVGSMVVMVVLARYVLDLVGKPEVASSAGLLATVLVAGQVPLALAVTHVSGKRHIMRFGEFFIGLLCGPVLFGLRLVDRGVIEKRLHNPLLQEQGMEKMTQSVMEGQYRLLEEAYRTGLRRAREEVLGPKSVFMAQKGFLEKELQEIRAEKEALQADMREYGRGHPELVPQMEHAIRAAEESEGRYQARLDRLTHVVLPKLQALLNRAEAHIAGIGVSVQIGERIKRMHKRAETDDAVLDAVDQKILQEIQRIADQLIRLQGALSGVLTGVSGKPSEDQLQAWMDGVEEAADEAVIAESLASSPIDSVVDGQAVH